MARSLNKVQLIGNLTRDPELRYTAQGTAVCTFGLATNRIWVDDSGEKHEEVEFHRIVAWNKLAELCAQLLFKGRKTYVDGRLQTRQWTGQDGAQRKTTEIVISDMIVLDSRQAAEAARVVAGSEEPVAAEEKGEERVSGATAEEVVGEAPAAGAQPADDKKADNKKKGRKKEEKEENPRDEEVKKEDIPF